MMDKPWKVVLVLVGMFAAGVVTGGFLAARVIKRVAEKRTLPEQWGPARLRMLADRLELTPGQQEKLRPIVRRDVEDLGRIRHHSFNETKRILERMERDISAVLTPEQRVKFEQINREFRARAERFMRERGPRGPGGGLRERAPRGDRPSLSPPAEEPADKPAGKPPGGG
jgi:Spy/CpxP family protein refolding chaperone